MLFAIVRGGLNNLRVIDMAVVESESNDSWDWILRYASGHSSVGMTLELPFYDLLLSQLPS